MRSKLIRRRRRFPRNRICLSDTSRSWSLYWSSACDSSTNYFREINIKRMLRSTTCRKFITLREKWIRSTIISRSEANVLSMRGECQHPLAINRAFAFALWMHLCSRGSRTRICDRKAFLSLVLSFLCRRSLFFPPECHHFGTFFPSFPSFVLSTLRSPSSCGKAVLKGGICLFVHAALLLLPSFSI